MQHAESASITNALGDGSAAAATGCECEPCIDGHVSEHTTQGMLCRLQFSADQPAKLEAFCAALEPLRQTLKQFKFLGGNKLSYADIAVAGNFLVCTI